MTSFITKLLTYVFILCYFTSCTGVRMYKSELHPIDANFKGSFHNRALMPKTVGADSTLLNLFELYGYKADSVALQFNSNNQLELRFGKEGYSRTFVGKFKHGYYQIYLRKEKGGFPPFVPLFYDTRDIDRLRITLTKTGDLIVDNKWERTARVLIMAGGGSGRKQYQFSSIKK